MNVMREVRREERRGDGEENTENNVQACNLKSSAQKVSQHRLRDLNLKAQIVPKCLPKGPSETLWTHLGQPLGIMGLLGRSLELLGSSLGAPGSDFGPLGDDFGSILG